MVNKTASSMRVNQRQQALLMHVLNQGRGLVDNLAQEFKVTPQTIRRDLNKLCDLRLLLRVHGGAVSPNGAADSGQLVNLDYNTRKIMSSRGKEVIGYRVSKIIPNGASLFINIGTTTEQVAEHLVDHFGLFVITNNINIANTLRRSESIKVMTAGGLVRREDGGIVGDATEDFVNQFKADFAVIGCSAIEQEGTILEYDIREVRVTNAMIRNARSVILVSDSSKFQRTATVRLCNVSAIDYFVTDQAPPEKFSEFCRQQNVTIYDESQFGDERRVQ